MPNKASRVPPVLLPLIQVVHRTLLYLDSAAPSLRCAISVVLCMRPCTRNPKPETQARVPVSNQPRILVLI
ncbi:MAG: hypothetical protein ACK55Z_25560 [bacterium]